MSVREQVHSWVGSQGPPPLGFSSFSFQSFLLHCHVGFCPLYSFLGHSSSYLFHPHIYPHLSDFPNMSDFLPFLDVTLFFRSFILCSRSPHVPLFYLHPSCICLFFIWFYLCSSLPSKPFFMFGSLGHVSLLSFIFPLKAAALLIV